MYRKGAFLTEFHEGAAVGSQNDTHPVERIGRLGGLYAVDWNLAAHQENEEGDDRPQNLLAEGNLHKKDGENEGDRGRGKWDGGIQCESCTGFRQKQGRALVTVY